jgi:hypothetical protein
MSRARRFHPVPLASSALCCAALCSVVMSCYRPDVLDGGFKCNTKVGSKPCPDGYRCDPLDSFCRKVFRDGGTLEVRDAMDAMDAPDVADVPEVGPQCFEPKPGCSPSDASASCDPFCQTGCMDDGCRQKCSVNTVGALTCNEVVPGTLRNEFQPCTLVNSGTGNQTDACAPGLVCLEDACNGIGSGSGRCYKFCRSDADCPNSQCYRALPGGWRVCDVPNVDTCVPTPGGGGCSMASQGCYIAIARPSHTVCDCTGSAGANELCDGSRSCFPGLLCVDPNGAGTICLRVCDLSLNGADCGALGSCRQYSGNTGGAMVNPKYGFCF